MKNSRIDSVALNGKQPLKIKPNHGWMIILLRRRVKKLMNMNEQQRHSWLSQKNNELDFLFAKYLSNVKKRNQSRNTKMHRLKLNNMLLRDCKVKKSLNCAVHFTER